MTSLTPIALHIGRARIKAFVTLLVKTTAQTRFPTATRIYILLTYLNKTYFPFGADLILANAR